MPKKISVLVLFFLIFQAGYTQTRVLDSLRKVIDQYPARDTVRLFLIMDYVNEAVNGNTTLLLPYINEVISISREIKYKKGIQVAYITAQLYFSDRRDMVKSLLYADSAFASLEGDTLRRALVNKGYLHNNVGGDYLKLGDYEQALHHYTKAAEILEKHYPQTLPAVFGGMAELFDHLKQTDRALEYSYKSIEAAEKYGNKVDLGRRNLNLITRLLNLDRYTEAEQLLEKIGTPVLEAQDPFSLILYHQSLGFVWNRKKNFPKAIEELKKAYQYAVINEDAYQEVSMLVPLTEVMMDGGQFVDSKKLLDTLLKKSIDGKMNFSQLKAYNNLAKWYSLQGDHKTANDYLNRKQVLSDSINSEELRSKIAMMETRFQVETKDKEIRLLQIEKQNQQLKLKQKEELNYILIGSAIALILILLLLYFNYRNKQKLQQQRISELETEKQLTATEAVLKGEAQERTRLAKDLHDGLGGMLSGIKHSFITMKGNLIMTPENQQAFERSIDMLDSSIKEMRRVAHNMMPEVLVKYGLDTALRDFCIEINKSGALQVNYQSIGMEQAGIEETTAIAIYRIAQELLNNIIRHAAATQAIVQLTRTDGKLTLTVEDDGKGFNIDQLEKPAGIGWQNIRNRVGFLKGNVDVRSGEGNGSSIMIEVDV